MKRTRIISVINDHGGRTEITIKHREKAVKRYFPKDKIEDYFENLCDSIYEVMAKRFHISAIKMRQS